MIDGLLGIAATSKVGPRLAHFFIKLLTTNSDSLFELGNSRSTVASVRMVKL